MSIAKQMQKDNLVDSIIALSIQIKSQQCAVAEGRKRWGQSPTAALQDSAKAMLYDVGKLQDMLGADEWSEKYRQLALSIIR